MADKHDAVLKDVKAAGKISDELEVKIRAAIEEFKKQFA
jgi:hypothetical protein